MPAVSPQSGMGSGPFPRKFSWATKPSLYGNTFHIPQDATNAKSSARLLQPVVANNAAADVMESTSTEVALVKKCFVPIVMVTTVQPSEDVLNSRELP